MSSFSWNATAQIRDTTHVVLPTEVARKAAIDLLEGDKAKEQVINLQESIRIQGEIISDQDSLVTITQKSLTLSKQEVQNLSNQIQQDAILQERLKGQIAKHKAYAIGFGCSTVAAVAGIIAILVLGGK